MRSKNSCLGLLDMQTVELPANKMFPLRARLQTPKVIDPLVEIMIERTTTEKDQCHFHPYVFSPLFHRGRIHEGSRLFSSL
jgi:hypothetical protein